MMGLAILCAVSLALACLVAITFDQATQARVAREVLDLMHRQHDVTWRIHHAEKSAEVQRARAGELAAALDAAKRRRDAQTCEGCQHQRGQGPDAECGRFSCEGRTYRFAIRCATIRGCGAWETR